LKRGELWWPNLGDHRPLEQIRKRSAKQYVFDAPWQPISIDQSPTLEAFIKRRQLIVHRPDQKPSAQRGRGVRLTHHLSKGHRGEPAQRSVRGR
jgi:hypothetical protein